MPLFSPIRLANTSLKVGKIKRSNSVQYWKTVRKWTFPNIASKSVSTHLWRALKQYMLKS